MRKIEITEKRIPCKTLHAALEDPSCGGVVTFEGRVRNHHEGRSVRRLYYECYRPMAIKILEKIATEAAERWDVKNISLTHRIGEIPIGELAVWIGVAAEHRAEAFAACRFAIEEIKSRVPIWKRETFADGSQQWVTCQHA